MVAFFGHPARSSRPFFWHISKNENRLVCSKNHVIVNWGHSCTRTIRPPHIPPKMYSTYHHTCTHVPLEMYPMHPGKKPYKINKKPYKINKKPYKAKPKVMKDIQK